MKKLKYIVCLVLILFSCSQMKEKDANVALAEEEYANVEQTGRISAYNWEENELHVESIQNEGAGTYNFDLTEAQESTIDQGSVEAENGTLTFYADSTKNNQNVTYNYSTDQDEIHTGTSINGIVANDNNQNTKLGNNYILIQFAQQNLEDFLDLLILYQNKEIDKEIREAALEALNEYINESVQKKINKFPHFQKENIQELSIEYLKEKEGGLFGKMFIKQENISYQILFEIENTVTSNGVQRSFKVVGFL